MTAGFISGFRSRGGEHIEANFKEGQMQIQGERQSHIKYSRRHKNGDISVPSKRNIFCAVHVPFPFSTHKRSSNTLGVSSRKPKLARSLNCLLESMLLYCRGLLNLVGILYVFCNRHSTVSRFRYLRSIEPV